jgi:hypothetical protein
MATTRNQELQASINQSHASIEHMTYEIRSTNSCIEKVENKFDTMEANFTTEFISLLSIVNQLLNRPTGTSSSEQPDAIDSS